MTLFQPILSSHTEMLLDMMADFYAMDGYPMERSRSAELLKWFLADQSLGRGWLVVFDGNIAGYLIITFVFSFEYGGQIAFVDELYIKESFRRKGLGKTAIAFTQSEVAQMGIQMLYLEVEPHNEEPINCMLAPVLKYTNAD